MPGRGTKIQRCITIRGREETCGVIHMKNRKRVTLLVDDRGDVQVRCPPGTSAKYVDALLVREADWIGRRLESVRLRLQSKPILEEGATLPFLGSHVSLRVGHWDSDRVFLTGGDLWIPKPGEHSLDVRPLLERWYRQRAKFFFHGRLHDWSGRMGVVFNRLTVRGQKSRWGSCSVKGNINLNWRLLWTSHRVVDYVMVHELSHLRHMNHSKEFWTLVARFIPDYQELRGCLKSLDSPW